MAFPTIPTVAAGRVLSALATSPAGTHTSPNLSSLTKNSGDLLIAIVIIYDGNSTNAEFSAWGGGFTEFGDFAGTATMGIGVAYKWSDGTETGTFTVTSADTSTNDSAFFLLSIPGAHPTTPPEAGGFATGTGAANPTSLNPAGWGTEDTLWIAVGGSGETSTTGPYTGLASAPTNYTDYVDSGISADVVGGVEGAVAFRQLNAASEDAGAFTGDTSNARGAALLIAVRPDLRQTLTLGLLDGAPALYAPALIFPTKSITLGLLDAGPALYAPTVAAAATQPFMSYFDTAIALDPSAYWRLGEPSGTSAVDVVTGLTGTYNNTPSLAQSGAVPGDTAVRFTQASTEWLEVPDDAAIDQGDVFTYAFWFKRASNGTYQVLFNRGANAPIIAFRSANTLECNIGSGITLFVSTVSVTDTNWHHLAWTKNGSANKLWLDKVDVTGSVTNATMSSNTSTLRIAWDGGSAGESFDGSLDEFGIWSRALSAAEIALLYDSRAIPRTSYYDTVIADTPVGYWPLDEPSGTTASDDSGNGRNGTYVNTPTFGVAGPLSGDSRTATSFARASVEYATVADNAAFDFGTGDFSLEIWYKLAAADDGFNKWLMSKADQFGFLIDSSGALMLDNFTAAAVSSTVQADNDTNWHHAVATRTGSVYKLYLDAVDVSGTNTTRTFAANGTDLHIGIESSLVTSTPWDGSLAHAAVYNYVLTPSQVLNHYAARINPTASYRQKVVDHGATHLWRLNEPSGTNANNDIGTLDGTYTNTPTLGVAGPLSGDPITATGFNGTDEYVLVADDASLDLGDIFSWEFWVKRTGDFATGGEPDIITKGSQGQVGFDVDDKLFFDNDGSVCSTSSLAVTDQFWHHYVVTRDDTVDRILIDGFDVTVAGTNAARSSNATDLNIGRYYSGAADYFAGHIANVAVYPGVLTTDQVRTHWVARTFVVSAGAQTITLPLLDGAPALYAPTVIPDQFVTLGLLDAGPTLYAPTITPKNTLTLALLDAGPTLYAPTVTPKNTVTLGLLDAAPALYAPTVIIDQFVTLGLLDGAPTLYAPTVTAAPLSITLALLDSVSALYAPTLYLDQFVALPLLDAGPALYAPTVMPAQFVTLGLLDGSPTLYAPTLTATALTIALSLLDASPALYAPTLVRDEFLTLGLLDGAPTLYAPTLTPQNTVTLPLLDGAPALYAPTVSPDQFVTLGLLDAGPALYAPDVIRDEFVTLALLDAGSALYAPTVTQIGAGSQSLVIPLLDGGAAVYAPTIIPGAVTLGLALLDSGSTLYAPTVAGRNTLTVPLLDGAPALYPPTVVQTTSITLPLLDAGANLYQPTLSAGATAIALELLDAGRALYPMTIGARRRGSTSARPSAIVSGRNRGSTTTR